ncbi:MAG TPA: ubiquinol-cytochrome C reductase, partial [Actinotalea sp.]
MSTDSTPRSDAVARRTDDGLPDRFPDPGIEEHPTRLGDTDPAASKRAERQVVVLLALSILGTIGFLVAYFAAPPDGSIGSVRTSTALLGLGLFVAMAGIGAAAAHWAKSIMSNREIVEDRHPQRSDAATREGAIRALSDGAADSGIARRGVLKGAVVTAVALAPLAIAVPLVGEVGGDWNVSKFRHTMWTKGRKLTKDPSGEPIKASDVTIGSAYHVIPDGLRKQEDWLEEKAKAVVLMVRLDPAILKEAPDRKGWSYEG